MASLKPIALSLALISLTSMVYANPLMPVSEIVHDTTWKQDTSLLTDALDHNSFSGHVPHHYLKGMHGLWLGGFGQVVGAYNSHYLLMPGRRTMFPSAGSYAASSLATISVPHADVLMGYDSNHVGFFVDYGYAINPNYPTLNTVQSLASFGVNEAYMTYRISPQFAIKAGHFISSFGDFDPTDPMTSLVGEITKYDFGDRLAVAHTNSFAANGFEGVIAANGFYGTVAGIAQDGASTPDAKGLTNDANFNTLILSGGYNVHFAQSIAGIDAGYTNRDWLSHAAWTAGLHLNAPHWQSGVQVYHAEALLSNNKRLWVMSGHVDYLFAKRFSIGGYGDYTFNMNNSTTVTIFPYHWNLGAKAGYAFNHAVTLDLYLQHQTALKSAAAFGTKNNTSGVLAVTVKV